MLHNATSIHSEDGQIESFVSALQVLMPPEEQERLPAEFVAMVGHEPRTPLTLVNGAVATLLDPPDPLPPRRLGPWGLPVSWSSPSRRWSWRPG